MLCRIRALVRTRRNHLAESSLLGEPLSSESSDGVPTELHHPRLSLDVGRYSPRDNVRLVAEPELVLERHFALEEPLLDLVGAMRESFLPV